MAKQHKWVYRFSEGNATRALLGGKGAGLSEMTKVGLPVPPGFTITTEACNAFHAPSPKASEAHGKTAKHAFPTGMWEQALVALKTIETSTGRGFGDAKNPLLISVRSGSVFSMPGMMDTVLNLGLNDETTAGIALQTKNERFAQDAYRRFIQLYGSIVLGIPKEVFSEKLEKIKKQLGAKNDTDLNAKGLSQTVSEFKKIVKEHTKAEFPQDPYNQLEKAIAAVFNSWNGERARIYRDSNKISHNLGTAVNIMAMVFGNMGDDSGTGVAFTRNPATGEHELYGEFLLNAQGEDVVAGIRTPLPIASLEKKMPEVYKEFVTIAQKLEKHYKDIQDIEFTIERGKLYMLQTRAGQRTASAAVKIACDLADKGIITPEVAVNRITPEQVEQLLFPMFTSSAKKKALDEEKKLTVGIAASPGAATGKVIFESAKAAELSEAGEHIILVRPETDPNDIKGILTSRGVLTARGGKTSHAAVVTRGSGIPAVVGAHEVEIDHEAGEMKVGKVVIKEGEVISIDGGTGEVFLGELERVEPDLKDNPDLLKILSWADKYADLSVWANADTPKDAKKARSLGAKGIGLCRTEHMFFGDRIPVFQKLIMAAPSVRRLSVEGQILKDEIKEIASNATVANKERKTKLAKRLEEVEKELAPFYATYKDALKKLLVMQRQDFVDILKAMDNLPVVIRLLDPPLHEFLPNYTELRVEVAIMKERKVKGPELDEKMEFLNVVDSLREVDPMLGLRGVRLGILYPEINEMQVQAIFEAACILKKQGHNPRPKVMIPLIGHVNELQFMSDKLLKVADAVMKKNNTKVKYQFGTMIETPRAAITAGEIARISEFFSFGSNDLTQMIFGYSRDDVGRSFLPVYVADGILPHDPFQTIDSDGVGKLISSAVIDGRKTTPKLEIGVCGEHGGDPLSIAFFHKAGLDYVSCSPFRVPIARLAAAQIVLKDSKYSIK
jgi:pyruvate,orthophosphate dikinase